MGPTASEGEPVWWDQRAEQRMNQYARAYALQEGAAEVRQRAAAMRLRAASMRMLAQSMRTRPRTGAAPAAAEPEEGSLARSVRDAVVTDQAKGLLAACLLCTPGQALALLQEHSRRANLPCAVIARQIVQNRGIAS